MQSGLTIESYPTMEESLSEQVLFYYFTEKNNPTEDIQFEASRIFIRQLVSSKTVK